LCDVAVNNFLNCQVFHIYICCFITIFWKYYLWESAC